MPEIRPHLLSTPHTGIRRMLDLARDVPNPLMLISGDPNFGTPAHIIDAAAEASHAGRTGYAPAIGLPPLREALAKKVHERNSITADADQICVSTGACGALFTSLMLLAGPGDDVLVPDPGWSNYAAMIHVLGARCIPYPSGLDEPVFDGRLVESLITPRTRAIVINSPSNPAGQVASPDDLRRVLEFAQAHDLWVISDEAYDEIVFDGSPRCSLAALGGEDRVVTIFSASKTYAMTGWRLGYAVGPASFITQLSLHQEPVFSSAPTISQHATLAAVTGDQACVSEMTDAYQRRRDVAAATLAAHDIAFVPPGGAFFVMVDVSSTGLDSWTFARRLLEEQHVGVVPGLAFGARGEGYVRISLAAADDVVEEGVIRMADLIVRLDATRHPAPARRDT